MTSTSARRSARLFRERVRRNGIAFQAVLHDKAVEREILDFCRRGTELGQVRALRKLRRRLAGVAVYESAQLGEQPTALWAALGAEPDGACVVVAKIGGCSTRVCSGAFNFRVTDHAILRFYERGGVDLEQAVVEAARAVRRGELYRLPEGGEVWVAAGPGAFIGRVDPGGFADAGVVRGRTWLSLDQMDECQEKRIVAV